MHRLPRVLSHRPTAFLRQPITPQTPFISHRAPSSQILYRPTGEPVRFQSVRFKRAGLFNLRRIATYLLYAGAAVGYFSLILRYLDIEIEFVDEEELEREDARRQADGQAVSEADAEDGPFYAEEDSLFIPLTWSKKIPRTYYRASDPEWQEFVKFSRDRARHGKVQDELVRLVVSETAKAPSVRRHLGKDMVAGKYWLDIIFPDGPPLEYERSGIEIGDDFIAWSQQRVSSDNQWRLVRALWPAAAAGGVWAATSALAGIQYRRIKQVLGWEGKDPQSPEEQFKRAVEIMQKQQEQDRGTKHQVGNAQTDPNTSPSAVAPASANSASDGKLPWHIPVHLPFSTTNSKHDANGPPDIPFAMHTFSQALSKAWNSKQEEPPRGSLIVQGLIELRGSRGRMLLDVQGAYDPRLGKYVRVTAGMRSFKKWSQSPRGGA